MKLYCSYDYKTNLKLSKHFTTTHNGDLLEEDVGPRYSLHTSSGASMAPKVLTKTIKGVVNAGMTCKGH